MGRFLDTVQLGLYIAVSALLVTVLGVGCIKLAHMLWTWPEYVAAPSPQATEPMTVPARSTLTCAGVSVVGNTTTNNNITITNESDAPMQVNVIDGVTCVTRRNR